MAISLFFRAFITIFVLTCFQWATSVRIDISPNSFTNRTKPHDVHISCLPEDLDEAATEIVFMKITKNGIKKPLAYIHQNFKISYSTNSTNHDFEVFGHLDKEFDKSYLNLTLKHPKLDESGIYTCAVFYVDDVGVLLHETASGNLAVEKVDVSALDSLVHKLIERVSYLEDIIRLLADKDSVTAVVDKVEDLENRTMKLLNDSMTDVIDDVMELQRTTHNHTQQIKHLADKDSVSKIATRVDDLEDTIRNQSRRMDGLCDKDSMADVLDQVKNVEETTRNQTRQMDDLCDKDSLRVVENNLTVLYNTFQNQTKVIDGLKHKVGHTTAFSASVTKKDRLSVGEAIHFSDVIMTKGQGYDPKTGVFTAPVSGLYTFHVVAMVNCFDCFVDIDLTTDTKVLATLSAEGDTTTYDQAAASIIAQLKAGDRVKAVVSSMTDGAVLNSNKLSLFSGYLISVD